MAPIALWPGCNFDRGSPSDILDASRPDAGPPRQAGPQSPLGVFEPCVPPLTPVDKFPAIFNIQQTELDPDRHALEIDGLVQRPVSIRLSDLVARAAESVTVVNSILCLIGINGTQVWTGIPLRDLLDLAGPDLERTRRLRLHGADGFIETLRTEDIYVDDDDEIFPPLLAYAIDDQPLPPRLGSPFRLLLADRFGFKNIKWLQRIELTADDSRVGVFEDPRYSDSQESGKLQVQTGIMRPRPPGIEPGPTQICGHAMSGHAGIHRVDIIIDGGSPITAELLSREALLAQAPSIRKSLQAQHPQRFPYPWRGVWTPFAVDWVADAGSHEIELRVTDRTGTINDTAMVAIDVG